MKSTLAVAAGLVLSMSATSFADLVYASSITDNRFAISNLDNVTFGSPTLNNGLGPPDGVLILETATGGGGFHALDLIVGFTYTSGGAVGPGVTIYGISTTGSVTLDFMTWGTDNTVGNGDDSGTYSINQTLGAGPVDLFVTGPLNSFDTAFASTNYTYVYFHFSMGDGAVLTVDAFSNPEPGTIALFALGAAGLGGFAVKRRRARLAARRSA